ncbi:MAG: hypothetical protein DRQ63_10275 [Gammaproteobacteria bacterium]|nr:MAG: hypothetical protein DRQ63_10275 [Gammaproteobacteria bacterium]
MQIICRMRDALVVNSLPTVVRLSQESSTLAEKLAIQIKWMQMKGIDISFKESERPRLEQKSPLPGTIIYFSSVS